MTETVRRVERSNGFWYVTTNRNTTFGFPEHYTKGVGKPCVGDTIECHTLDDVVIRGVTLRGEQLYFLSEEELFPELPLECAV